MNKTSQTAAGPSKSLTAKSSSTTPSSAEAVAGKTHSVEHIDTINQVFALFRVNYHNQFYAALSDAQLLNQTKKLWADSLSRFSAQTILRAAKRVIEESEYLPTLRKMLDYCRGDNSDYGLPDVRQAYLEACHASSPKTNYAWSHPAVYFAGRDSDWFFLASNNESITYPIFRENYQRWCEKVKAGETLPRIEQKKLPESSNTPLDKASNKKHLQKLRDSLSL